jgi:hypothetical protein
LQRIGGAIRAGGESACPPDLVVQWDFGGEADGWVPAQFDNSAARWWAHVPRARLEAQAGTGGALLQVRAHSSETLPLLAQLRASAGGTLDLELERGVELRLVCLLADRQPFEGARLSVGVHAPLESTIGRTTTRYLER